MQAIYVSNHGNDRNNGLTEDRWRWSRIILWLIGGIAAISCVCLLKRESQ